MKQVEKDLFREGRKAGYKGKKLLEYVRDALNGTKEAEEIVEGMIEPLKRKRGRPRK